MLTNNAQVILPCKCKAAANFDDGNLLFPQIPIFMAFPFTIAPPNPKHQPLPTSKATVYLMHFSSSNPTPTFLHISHIHLPSPC